MPEFKTNIERVIAFFGLREGQSRMDFMRDEYKKLSEAERIEIAAALDAQGYTVNPNLQA